MKQSITFERALIKGIKHKIGKGGSVVSVIEFVAAFSAKTAESLVGDKFAIFTRDDIPREVLRKTELDIEVFHVRLVHVPQRMTQYTLDITPDLLSKFQVFKSGGKKKGKSALVRVKFEATTTGALHQAHSLLDHVAKVGQAEGALTVTALSEQSDMFKAPPKEDEKKGRRKKGEPLPAEQTTIEQAQAEVATAAASVAEAITEQVYQDVPVTAEAAAEVQTVQAAAAAERQYPEAKEDGTFPIDNADKLTYAHPDGKAVATIYTLEVKEGFAGGYSIAFANNIGERRSLPDILSIHTSENEARSEAARCVYRFAQTIYAEGTPQVKNVARQVEAWAAQHMTFDRQAVPA